MGFLNENALGDSFSNRIFRFRSLSRLPMKDKAVGVMIIVGLCVYFLYAFYLLGKIDAEIKATVYHSLGVPENK